MARSAFDLEIMVAMEEVVRDSAFDNTARITRPSFS